jgi:hypothetical protein
MKNHLDIDDIGEGAQGMLSIGDHASNQYSQRPARCSRTLLLFAAMFRLSLHTALL